MTQSTYIDFLVSWILLNLYYYMEAAIHFPPYSDLQEPVQQLRNCVLVRQAKYVTKEKKKKGIKLRPMSLKIKNFT